MAICIGELYENGVRVGSCAFPPGSTNWTPRLLAEIRAAEVALWFHGEPIRLGHAAVRDMPALAAFYDTIEQDLAPRCDARIRGKRWRDEERGESLEIYASPRERGRLREWAVIRDRDGLTRGVVVHLPSGGDAVLRRGLCYLADSISEKELRLHIDRDRPLRSWSLLRENAVAFLAEIAHLPQLAPPADLPRIRLRHFQHGPSNDLDEHGDPIPPRYVTTYELEHAESGLWETMHEEEAREMLRDGSAVLV